ncbi:hypothetical protein [Gimesia panareensis]|uniref:Uncharacterized protein n=1 Tax=Gimesia panareensis TaxID=2527978 RepID=A0A518FM06_9PLAN|nr:hypothetical protein [Gimesia panareensis]QDU49449.1 hypothetical protein Pan110_17860 [Gimesia panareensis]QDV17327.1 hypothetical protein Pan153_19620 [Gimesia panareensis]
MIQGHPNHESFILDVQGKLTHGGCLEICNGSAIWACADCGHYVTDDAYLMDELNTELMQTYYDAIDQAFESFEMIDEDEVRKIKGLKFLRGFTRKHMTDGFFEMEKTKETMFIIDAEGSRYDVDAELPVFSQRFPYIEEYLGESQTKEFSVRLNKEECVAIATRVAPGRIRVRRK